MLIINIFYPQSLSVASALKNNPSNRHYSMLCFIVYIYICLGTRKVNFLLDVDGKPKIAIISHNLCQNVTLPVETADHSEVDTKRLIGLFVQLNTHIISLLYYILLIIYFILLICVVIPS